MDGATPEQINALPDEVRDYIHHLEANCDPAGVLQENFNLRENVRGLSQWVSDLQSGMYVNCVYCGHRYGPDPGTPVALADVLKDHIAQCPKHPLSIMIKRCEHLEWLLKKAWQGIRLMGSPVPPAMNESIMPQKECSRASGEAPCDTCRRELRKHLQPLPEGCPTMVEDCQGRWWKL
jgi:hypothetical protein